MGTVCGLQLDVMLNKGIPKDLALWIQAHMQGSGEIDEINRFFSHGIPGFDAWKGGQLLRQPSEEWHLKSNGVSKNMDRQKIAFFLNELAPWVVVNEDKIIARLVTEDYDTVETIFWYGPHGDVCSRSGYGYGGENTNYVHPKELNKFELDLSWGKEIDYPTPGDDQVVRWCFPKRNVVGIKTQKKKTLAEQHNADYIANKAKPPVATPEVPKTITFPLKP